MLFESARVWLRAAGFSAGAGEARRLLKAPYQDETNPKS